MRHQKEMKAFSQGSAGRLERAGPGESPSLHHEPELSKPGELWVPCPSSPSLPAGRNTVLPKNLGQFFQILPHFFLWLFGCPASPSPPFWELTCPKRYLSTWTHPLSLFKKAKIIPSLLFITLLGNAGPQSTFNNSNHQAVNPEDICPCFKAL